MNDYWKKNDWKTKSRQAAAQERQPLSLSSSWLKLRGTHIRPEQIVALPERPGAMPSGTSTRAPKAAEEVEKASRAEAQKSEGA